MKIKLSKMFPYKRMVLTGIFAALLFAACGCSKAAPACDGGKTIDAVISLVSRDLKKDLAAIAGMGGPGMELSEDEWRTIRAGMVIDLENIRENSFDEAAGQRTCAANLMIVRGGKKEIIPVTYVAETNRDTGDIKATLSGFREYKKAQKLPLPSR